MDCIFCEIINNNIPSYTIYEDNIIKVFLDINPKTPGHSLIIPKKHYKDLYDIDNDTLIHINNICKKICDNITTKLNCNGFTILNNIGSSQEVKHFHVHIVPQYNINTQMDIKEVQRILKTDTI